MLLGLDVLDGLLQRPVALLVGIARRLQRPDASGRRFVLKAEGGAPEGVKPVDMKFESRGNWSYWLLGAAPIGSDPVEHGWDEPSLPKLHVLWHRASIHYQPHEQAEQPAQAAAQPATQAVREGPSAVIISSVPSSCQRIYNNISSTWCPILCLPAPTPPPAASTSPPRSRPSPLTTPAVRQE